MKAKIELIVDQADLVKILQADQDNKDLTIRWFQTTGMFAKPNEISFDIQHYSGPYLESDREDENVEAEDFEQ